MSPTVGWHAQTKNYKNRKWKKELNLPKDWSCNICPHKYKKVSACFWGHARSNSNCACPQQRAGMPKPKNGNRNKICQKIGKCNEICQNIGPATSTKKKKMSACCWGHARSNSNRACPQQQAGTPKK